MSAQIVMLECSQRDADLITEGQAEWVTRFPEPISINNGDVIQLKQALINTQSATSGNIVLEEAITIEIDFGYYITVANQDFVDKDNGNQQRSYFKRFVVGGGYAEPGIATADDRTYTAQQKDNDNPVKYFVLRETQVVNPDPGPAYLPYNIFKKTFSLSFPAGSYSPNKIADLITDKLSTWGDSLINASSITGGAGNDTKFLS